MVQTEIVPVKYETGNEIIRVELSEMSVAGKLQGYPERPKRVDIGRSVVEHDGGFFWIVSYGTENLPDMLHFSLFRKTACRIPDPNKLESVEVCKHIIDSMYIGLLNGIKGLPGSQIGLMVPSDEVSSVL